MKLIRLWGVLVFPVLVGLIALFYYLFAERLIKHGIESVGTSVVGAKVELDQVTLDWRAATVQLKRLQVTNKNQPMRNLVEIENIVADLDFEQLLWLRSHIETMAIKGMQFDTPRQSSGAIADAAEQDRAVFDLLPELGSFDWGSLTDQSGWQKLFDNLQLDSLNAVDELRSDLKQAETDIKGRIDALPNHEALKAYETRLKALTTKLEGDKLTRALQLVERGKELDKLRKELKAEAAKVSAIEEQYKASKKQLQAQYERVKKAPEKDIEKVLAQLSVEVPGTDQLLSRVLGPDLNRRLQQGTALYQEASPWIAKAQVLAGKDPNAPPPPARFAGIDVHFPLHDPQPEFWLKNAHLDGQFNALGKGFQFNGDLNNVSDSPDAIAAPTTLQLSAQAQGGGQAQLNATVDQRRASPAQRFDLDLKHVALNDLPLSTDPQLAMTVKEAQLSASIKGEATPTASMLMGRADFAAMQWSMSTNSEHRLLRAVMDELQKTSAVDVEFSWRKTADQESKTLNSSLDDIAKRAVKNVLKQELDAKKSEVKAKLRERANAELAKLDLDWNSLSALEPLLGDKLKSLNEMIDKAKKP